MPAPCRMALLRLTGHVPYSVGLAQMESAAAVVKATPSLAGCLLLLEHLPVISVGRRLRPKGGGDDSLPPDVVLSPEEIAKQFDAEIHVSPRGGKVTCHMPGQVVAYPIVNLRALPGKSSATLGVREYVHALEDAVSQSCASFDAPFDRVKPGREPGREGAWVEGTQRKIASVGVRVSAGIATHGVALNVSNDLRLFDAVVPCGLEGVTMTSMWNENGGSAPTFDDVASKLACAIADNIGAQPVWLDAAAELDASMLENV